MVKLSIKHVYHNHLHCVFESYHCGQNRHEIQKVFSFCIFYFHFTGPDGHRKYGVFSVAQLGMSPRSRGIDSVRPCTMRSKQTFFSPNATPILESMKIQTK